MESLSTRLKHAMDARGLRSADLCSETCIAKSLISEYLSGTRSNWTFAAGQAYAALSRCRSIKKLYLLAPVQATDILVNNRVVEFMQEIITPSPPSATPVIDDGNNYQPKPPTNISPNGDDVTVGFGGDDELQKLREDNEQLKETIKKLNEEIQNLKDRPSDFFTFGK